MLKQFVSGVIPSELSSVEHGLLPILLFDRSTRKNLIWATDDYAFLGEVYEADKEILPESITGEQSDLIQPRAAKGIEAQQNRVREKAEVFTPSWICNQQNNLVDEAWFGRKDVFNTTEGQTWIPTEEPICFDEKGNHTWQRYVDAKRLEITCGEAPYLVSRFDVTTGNPLPLKLRVGLLDRKLRVVNENTVLEEEWITWAVRAVQSVYGFEYQGDSLLLARLNVFFSFLDYYVDRYQELPKMALMERVANIISWNLWQMDGTKYVVPHSCKPISHEETTLFGTIQIMEPCPGCKEHLPTQHTGVYCRIKDWRANQSCRYIDLLKGATKHGRI